MGKDLDYSTSFPTTISVSYLEVIESDDEEDVFSIDALGFAGLFKLELDYLIFLLELFPEFAFMCCLGLLYLHSMGDLQPELFIDQSKARLKI